MTTVIFCASSLRPRIDLTRYSSDLTYRRIALEQHSNAVRKKTGKFDPFFSPKSVRRRRRERGGREVRTHGILMLPPWDRDQLNRKWACFLSLPPPSCVCMGYISTWDRVIHRCFVASISPPVIIIITTATHKTRINPIGNDLVAMACMRLGEKRDGIGVPRNEI